MNDPAYPLRLLARIWAAGLYPSHQLLSARVSAFLNHLREAFPDGSPEELARYVGNG